MSKKNIMSKCAWGLRITIKNDLNWIIILFFIHIDRFREEKVEESTHDTVFIDMTQFGKMGSAMFRERFEASNNVFRGLKFYSLAWNFFMLILHIMIFPTTKESYQSKSV